MRVTRIKIINFRGIKSADILLPQYGVLVGDNNTGKTTIFEALDLVLGVDRLNRQSPVDEHDFFKSEYTWKPPYLVDAEGPKIEIEVTVADLNIEQKERFASYIEFWDSVSGTLYIEPDPSGIDQPHIVDAIRITFRGWYNEEEDDFEGETYFTRSLAEDEEPQKFFKKDKQLCGFLYLRSLRTGSRAFSLERGSLLDIVLRLKEIRPQMWENTLNLLAEISVAGDASLGISPILESVNMALKKYVPKEWGVQPHLKVSNLTRENLRKIITAFIGTGSDGHFAPFHRQGAGTINMLVLAMLSQIAESKQSVIFAMEEPETAIPPYAQKRVVHEIRKLASQGVFTSHSPYVLEEFSIDETVVLFRSNEGILDRKSVKLPKSVKLKKYRQEFRIRFCEGLLARRVLIAEGATEASAFPVVARRLAELNPGVYSSLEALGICIIDAGGQDNIPDMAKLYRDLGKCTLALCDKQSDTNKSNIEAHVDLLLMHAEKGIEDLTLNGTSEIALKRFVELIDWPQHLKDEYPEPKQCVVSALRKYFCWAKANWSIADFLAQCDESEIPEWLRDACLKLKYFCTVTPVEDMAATSVDPCVNLEARLNASDQKTD